MSQTPRVLVLVSYFLPGFKAGGPARTIANLVAGLGRDLDFSIVTRDRDLGDEEPYPGIQPNRWQPWAEARVNYRSPEKLGLAAMGRLLSETPHDVLYLNSLFDLRLTTLPLVARRLGRAPRTPLVIAPRGELAPAALALKRARKVAYLQTLRAAGIMDGAIWMASSEFEAQDIRRAVPTALGNVIVASDLASPFPNGACAITPPPPRHAGDPLRVVFLSRISPMKNLDYALRLLARVEVPVMLDIFGPSADAAYLAECRALAAALPALVQARFFGEVAPDEVHATLGRYDLMLLPTRGENFGHVILESLAAGTPVLISDRTLWSSEGEGACEALALEEPEAFLASLSRRARMSAEEDAALRARARLLASRFANDPSHVEANRALFYHAAVKSSGG
jgi:glycosyltransferase involved in cell wall biosynthesis